MSLTTGPFTLTAGSTRQLAPPSSVQWEQVVLTNLSQFVLSVMAGTEQFWVAPWTESRFRPSSTTTPVSVTPSVPAGATVTSGTGAQVQATWYMPGEAPLGQWPVALTAPAVAAIVSGTVDQGAGGASAWLITGGVAASQSGAWTVTANQGTSPWVVSGTVAATQSGAWSVSAAQSGVWTVAISGGTIAATQSGAWTVTANQGTSPWVVSGTVAATQSGAWTVTQSGTWTVTTVPTKSATGAPANVSAATSSTLLLAANGNRKGATVFNDSVAVLYLLLVTGGTATTTDFTTRIAAGGYYEVPFDYTGDLVGIWSAATGAARVTEFT